MRLLKQLRMSAISIGLALGLASGAANAWRFPDTGTVSSTVTQSGSETWDYQFTVLNTAYDSSVNSFEIPWFNDAGITNITAPAGWNNDTTYEGFLSGYATATEFLLWNSSTTLIAPGQSLSGFGFTASYAPVKGPFALGFDNWSYFIGDPAIPGSPSALNAGYTEAFPVTNVPEPETYALMLAGLGLLGFAARRRKTAQH